MLFVPESKTARFRYGTLVATGFQFLFGTIVFFGSNNSLAGINNWEQMQFSERLPWINLNLGGLGSLKVEYLLGVDGLSIGLVWLSGIVLFIGAPGFTLH